MGLKFMLGPLWRNLPKSEKNSDLRPYLELNKKHDVGVFCQKNNCNSFQKKNSVPEKRKLLNCGMCQVVK